MKIKYLIGAIMIFIMGVFILTLNSFNIGYDKLTIVESKEDAIESLNTAIPKEIVIYTDFYTQTVITSKLEIDDILECINTIKKTSSEVDGIIESDKSSYTVKGKILYNNKIDNFTLSNKLNFNSHVYNTSSYLINSLHRKLFNYFNTHEHLIDILRNDNSDVVYLNKDNDVYLNKKQQNELANKLSKLKIMNDEMKLYKTKIDDKKMYTLKIRINKKFKNKTNNLIFLDVYKEYSVIQFLADDNGKKIYMEGSINEI
ncbi:MAG: DUF3919 family protein [Romboutsia sp.]|uniref:DUF3919 family protein n=1 Tax=Clostridium sp. TaxID=1506 RepID=UPI002FC7B017